MRRTRKIEELAEEGLVRLEPASGGPRARIQVRPAGTRRPKLSLNRAWSRPSGGIDDETLIAQVLARPTFNDMLECVDAYGIRQTDSDTARTC